HCCGKRRNLPASWLRRSGTGLSRDAWRSSRVIAGRTSPGACTSLGAAQHLHNRYSRAGSRDDPERRDGENVMELRSSKFDDRRMEVMMGRLLQAGVLLASAVVLVGGILFVHAHHGIR